MSSNLDTPQGHVANPSRSLAIWGTWLRIKCDQAAFWRNGPWALLRSILKAIAKGCDSTKFIQTL